MEKRGREDGMGWDEIGWDGIDWDGMSRQGKVSSQL